MKQIDVLIPTHNDEIAIQTTLDSILDQTYGGDYGYNVVVVANGCTDNTIHSANTRVASFAQHEHADLTVIEVETPNKIFALNTGLLATANETVLCVDGDVTFSPTCFDLIADKMQQPGVIVSGAVPKIVVPPSTRGTLLGEIQEVGEIAWTARQNDTIPFGDAMAFKREAVPAFPPDAGVDDTWLGLYVSHYYGIDAVQIETNASVFKTFPTSWSDWLTQRTRWARNNDLVTDRFPHFKHVLAERLQRADSFDEIDHRTLAEMTARNIPAERLGQYRFFARLAAENAVLVPDIVKSDGTWDRSV